jgi:uncharacterized protein
MASATFQPGRVTVAALDRGSDLLSEIERLVRENDIEFCALSGIGSLDSARVTYYDQEKQEDREVAFERPMMLITVDGTAMREGAEVQTHGHVVLGDASGAAFGGDISPGCVVFSCELVMTELVGPRVGRRQDPATGLERLRLSS